MCLLTGLSVNQGCCVSTADGTLLIGSLLARVLRADNTRLTRKTAKSVMMRSGLRFMSRNDRQCEGRNKAVQTYI